MIGTCSAAAGMPLKGLPPVPLQTIRTRWPKWRPEGQTTRATLTSTTMQGVDGAVFTVDRAMDFLVAVDFVETVERIETVDGVRLATGLSLAGSEDLLLTEGAVRDATEGGRFGMRGVLGPVVCTLEVGIEDAAEDFLVRPTLLGLIPDRAVSNVVVFSLAIDAIETVDGARDGGRDGGHEPPEGMRRPEGPAAGLLRIVDVVERVERTELATDSGRGKRSGAIECTQGVPLHAGSHTVPRERVGTRRKRGAGSLRTGGA